MVDSEIVSRMLEDAIKAAVAECFDASVGKLEADSDNVAETLAALARSACGTAPSARP